MNSGAISRCCSLDPFTVSNWSPQTLQLISSAFSSAVICSGCTADWSDYLGCACLDGHYLLHAGQPLLTWLHSSSGTAFVGPALPWIVLFFVLHPTAAKLLQMCPHLSKPPSALHLYLYARQKYIQRGSWRSFHMITPTQHNPFGPQLLILQEPQFQWLEVWRCRGVERGQSGLCLCMFTSHLNPVPLSHDSCHCLSST